MGKRKVISEEALKELVLPVEGEVLGRVVKLLGSDHILVQCADGKTRMGRIRGKLKRKIWVRDSDVVLIEPWDFNEQKGDIVWRYTFAQIDWLKENNYLPKDF